jgi:hypothetical protein
MHRRSLLARVAPLAVAGLAGCTGWPPGDEAGARAPRVALRLERATDRGLAERQTVNVAPDGRRSDLVRGAVENGSATHSDLRPLLEDGDRVIHEDGVHELAVEVTDRQPATLYQVKIEDVAYVTTEAGARSIRFEELPDVDREKFRPAHDDGEPLGIGTNFVYTDAERAESVLVPKPQYSVIVWGPETRGKFVVEESHEAELKTYRYTAERVADVTAYGRRIRERYVFELSDLPAEERDIVETAIDREDGYRRSPDATPTDAFRSLARRFEPHDSVGEESESDIDGTYLVRYEGEGYLANLRVSGSISTPTPTQ